MARWLPVLTMLLLCCKSEVRPRPTPNSQGSSSAYETLFVELGRAMSVCDATAVERLCDLDAMRARVAGVSHGAWRADDARLDLHGIGRRLCTQAGDGAAYTYLRTQVVDGKPRPLFRLIKKSDGALNYHSLEMNVGGIVDIYNFHSGQLMSEMFATVFKWVETAKTGDVDGVLAMEL